MEGVGGRHHLLIVISTSSSSHLERDDLVEETEEGKVLKEKLLAGEAAQQAALEAKRKEHKGNCHEHHHHHDHNHNHNETGSSLASSQRSWGEGEGHRVAHTQRALVHCNIPLQNIKKPPPAGARP